MAASNKKVSATGAISNILPAAMLNHDVHVVVETRDRVLEKWGTRFLPENLDELTIDEFQSFLRFKENGHWTGLERNGARIKDIERLRATLRRLQDADLTLAERLDGALSTLEGFGKAIATGILMVTYPDNYAVWNSTSEAALKKLGLWPRLQPPVSEGNRYAAINETLLELSAALGLDLWTLDSVLWYVAMRWNPSDEPRGERYWWVNQGSTFNKERQHSVLCATLKNLGHHKAIRELRPGDLVVHYANGAIRAVSRVQGEAQERPRPYDVGGELSLVARATYSPLAEPIPVSAIPEVVRRENKETFNASGDLNQKYLTPVNQGLIDALVSAGLLTPNAEIPDRPRRSFLMTWNPANWAWEGLEKDAEAVRAGRPASNDSYSDRWLTGNHSVEAGDRIYLVRVGQNPKGITASGVATSSVYSAPHYSGDPQKKGHYVNLAWDHLLVPGEDELLSLDRLDAEVSHSFRWTPQMSGTEIPKDVADHLEKVWAAHTATVADPVGEAPGDDIEVSNDPELEPYTVDQAAADLFDPNLAHKAVALLKRKKNLVLQGPPGVGKTFAARRIAYALIGAKDDARLGWVQFHQSYSYEDFIEGYRPCPVGGFALRKGLFLEFCQRAAKDPGRDYVLVIDEINRGNLSRIFGEVLSLIEADKRGDLSLALAYAEAHQRFTVPPNVHLLGLMNTADRSLAVVDYALRRRFVFLDVLPRIGSAEFDAHLEGIGISQPVRSRVTQRFGKLNERIVSDTRNLGRGFEIGHSFFCPGGVVEDEEAWYRDVVEFEIAPLLREYWFDDPQRADKAVADLLA